MEITLKEVVDDILIKTPIQIRSTSFLNFAEGILHSDGVIEFNRSSYHSPEKAMQAALTHCDHQKRVSSTGWQFWAWYSQERKAWTPLEHLRARFSAKSIQHQLRTSDTHPLRIDRLSVPNHAGQLGLTFCPGKSSEGLYGGVWQRNLHKDIESLKSVGTRLLVSLMEADEFKLLGVPGFQEHIRAANIEWAHLPIQDMSIPDASFERDWCVQSSRIRKILQEGGLVVIHCRGGLGRTGLLAARILVELGISPVEAIRRVKSARINSIETFGQEEYILYQHWSRIKG